MPKIDRRRFLKGVGSASAATFLLPIDRIQVAFASSPVCIIAPDHKAETMTALVDTVIPGPPLDESPGGVQAGIDEVLPSVLDRFIPGFPLSDILVVELDRHAALVEPGQTFACLSPEGRDQAIELMEASPEEQERLISLLAVSLPMLLYYSEIGGAVSWPQTGFPGPEGAEGWAPEDFACPSGVLT